MKVRFEKSTQDGAVYWDAYLGDKRLGCVCQERGELTVIRLGKMIAIDTLEEAGEWLLAKSAEDQKVAA